MEKLESKNVDGAIDDFRACLASEPQNLAALTNLGVALLDEGRPDEALPYLRRAALTDKGSRQPEVLMALGNTLSDLGYLDQAIAALKQGVALAPDYRNLHLNLALTHLTAGDFENGWREYEWRFGAAGSNALLGVSKDYAVWHGEPLDGKTIIVHCEQGFGDNIQFARYLPDVAASAARVIVRSPAPLVTLLKDVRGVADVVPATEFPDADVQAAMMSLPYWLRINEIPAPIPYVSAPKNSIQLWKERIGSDNGVRIGVAWTGEVGNTRNRVRSFTEEEMKTLVRRIDVPGVSIYNLQWGESEAFKRVAGVSQARSFDLTGHIRDVSDTAALIPNLDAVVTVDTMIAHLSGALGAKAWTAVALNADWRWLKDRGDSPWYPSMSLVRQTEVRSWSPVLETLADEVHQLCVSLGGRTKK